MDNNEAKLDLGAKDWSKLLCANPGIIVPLATRLCINCEEIELNTNNVKIVLNNDRLLRNLEACDCIEINGVIFRKEDK